MILIIGLMIFNIFFNNSLDCLAEEMKSKKPLPYFRRKVEEITEDTNVARTDDSQSQLVSYLVKNVKAIFGDVYNDHPTVTSLRIEYDGPTEFPESTLIFKPTHEKHNTIKRGPVFSALESGKFIHTDDVMSYENLTLTPLPFLIDVKHTKAQSTQVLEELTEKVELLDLSKNLMLLGKAESKEVPYKATSSNESDPDIPLDTKRSCIFCDSVAFEDCNNPKNKLVPSIVCEKDDDLCFSQHTPFGIVTRGCYNVNFNKTVFVCSCNLCNYISIGETPSLFTKPQNWLDNVFELSRTRRLRKSVFKEMSCLKCEVNTTASRGDMLNDANCLEGNIGSLPTQVCKSNEICGIKVVRHNGYVWRGCIKKPLYNYWLTLCDSDLCNYDPIISVYDIL